jgi:hypothetical protein
MTFLIKEKFKRRKIKTERKKEPKQEIEGQMDG